VCARVSFKLDEEFFLGFHDTASTTGDSIATILLDGIKDLGLDIHNCRCQTYDGAANMSGHVKGVQAKILEVALQDGTESSKFLQGALEIAHETGKLFKESAKRVNILETVAAEHETEMLTVKPLCKTRWTVRHHSLDHILRQYGILIEALEEVSTLDSCRGQDVSVKAAGLVVMMRNTTTYFALCVARCVRSL